MRNVRFWLPSVAQKRFMLNASSRVNTFDVYDHRKTIAMHRRGQGSNEVSRGLFLESSEKVSGVFRVT